MENLNPLLDRYEKTLIDRPGRTMAKTAQEIYDDAWVIVCNMLNERAGLSSTRPEDRKYMRFAAREIQMARNNKEDLINTDNVERIKGAERQCYYVLTELLDSMTLDHDKLASYAAAGHPFKRRMQTIIPRLKYVILTLGKKASTLKETDAEARKQPQKPQGAGK